MRHSIAVATLFALSVASGFASAQHDSRHGPDRPPDRGPGFHGENDRRDFAYRHDFHRGERLPNTYRSRQYVVDDWRHHRLPPPPRGHQWVQVGADYVLIAIPTGVIVQVVAGH